MGVIDLAVENKIEFDYKETDIELMMNSVKQLESQIDEYKNKLAYVWKYGTPSERAGN